MAKIERKRKERFGTLPTELPGVQLRTEPGTKLNIMRKTIENFYQLARQFAEIKFKIDKLTDQQASLRDEIIGLAKKHEGLRGLTSEVDNFVLTVIPKEEIIWDRELLKESLGITYSAVVREDLIVNVTIPVGFRTKKGVTISGEVLEKAIRKALVNLGISEEDLTKVMRQEVNITPDEEKIAEMVNLGQVKLFTGTKTSEITWQARVDRLKK